MSDSGQTVLVTGAGGFVGRHLTARLVADGWRTVATDVTRQPTAPATPHADGNLTRRTLDVRDAAAVAALIEETHPDVVFHLAAQASVTESMLEPLEDVATNVLGTMNIAIASIGAGVRRIVYFSTGGALFGEPSYQPVDEEHLPQPTSVYGASKVAAELYLAALTAESATTVSVLRPGNIYGPTQDHRRAYGVVGIFAGRMLRGESVTIFGDGDESRDYVYVDDIVEAALAAASGEPATCIISSGVATTTRHLFELVAAETAYTLPPRFEPARPGEIRGITLSSRHAQERWGWTPRTSIEEGVRRSVAWHRAQLPGDAAT
ncbi:MAG: NAD-dependent epimerase/dehydratase family protein [Chloroflexi bacterium]|nr:NAD-dependent epimerase/dehydratase family protein [Chloroflexota bacterium]